MDDILSLPRIADPHILSGDRGVVTASLHHIRGQSTLLGLVLVLNEKHTKVVGQQSSSEAHWKRVFFFLFFFFFDCLPADGITHVENVDEEVGLLALTAKLLLGLLDVLLEFAHGILQSCAGVVNLVDNQDVLANQVGHLQRAQIEPLGAGHLGANGLLGITTTKILVERQTDSLDGDVGLAGALEERTGDPRWKY